MPSTIQDQIRFLTGYIKFLQSVPSDESGSAEPLLTVLRIFRCALRQRSAKNRPFLGWVETMTTGARQAADILEELCEQEAETIGEWMPGQPVRNHQQALTGILVAAIRTLCADIEKAERMYPEMTTHFQEERDRYYMVRQEAREAEALE